MKDGRERLWLWFGLSRASWLTMPRVMMHSMSDDWQNRMAELCEEWDNTWVNQPDWTTSVKLKSNGRFIKSPYWLLNYRHPDENMLSAMKIYPQPETEPPK